MKRGESEWRVTKDDLLYIKLMDRKRVYQKDSRTLHIDCSFMAVEYKKQIWTQTG